MTGWLVARFRVRLGTLVAAAVGLTVALAALAVYISVRHQLYSQIDSSLNEELAFLAPQGQFRPDVASASSAATATAICRSLTPRNVDLSCPELACAADQSADPGWPPPALAPISATSACEVRPIASHRRSESEHQHPRGDPDRPAAHRHRAQPARPARDPVAGDAGRHCRAVGLGYVIGRATIRPVERLTAAAEHVAATQDLARP